MAASGLSSTTASVQSDCQTGGGAKKPVPTENLVGLRNCRRALCDSRHLETLNVDYRGVRRGRRILVWMPPAWWDLQQARGAPLNC